MNAPDAYTRFLALVRTMGAARRVDCDYRLYEEMKRQFQRDFPNASPAEYEQAMRAISRAAGV